MYLLWGLFDFLSYMTLLNFVSVNTPGSANNIVTMIYSFAQADWLPTDLIFGALFTFDDDADMTYTDQFNNMGVGSLNLINNIGSAFVWYNLDFISLLLVVMISLVIRLMPR